MSGRGVIFLPEEWIINRETRERDESSASIISHSDDVATVNVVAAEKSSSFSVSSVIPPAAVHIGWTPQSSSLPANELTAKLAAMNALAALAPFEPVASVGYTSSGRVLILADATQLGLAKRAAETLAANLPVAMVIVGPQAGMQTPITVQDEVELAYADDAMLTGYLGAFEVTLVSTTSTKNASQVVSFDVVLDLMAKPRFTMHSPPQGYLRATDHASLEVALVEIPDMVGEFEKPKFFAYKETICAHSRSKKVGCNKCIDVCSTKAISSAGDIVKVDPHLCMGCGACATVCPSGAMSYQYPRVADRGAQLRAVIGAYRQAASEASFAAPTVLFHNGTDGLAALTASIHAGVGLPTGVLPIDSWHVASIGIDVMLGAIVYGAKQVVLLMAGSESPAYREATQQQMDIAQVILNSLGFAGKHFAILPATPSTDINAFFMSHHGGATVAAPATFHLSNDKRGTLEFIVEHLLRSAKVKPVEIPLPAGSPFGRVNVDVAKCTLCLACAGACPESALMDGGDYPRLKFLERNCVQCGLCEKTCPENAITLAPRLLLTDARKQEATLNESVPFDCISCGKALGTKAMIDNLLGKLSGHSMFQGDGKINRLKMCADCRVVDMMSNKAEYSVLTGKAME